MADETVVRGIARELSKSSEEGRTTVRFWLQRTDGRKIAVEAQWDPAIQPNDLVEVKGTFDHEGTLQATAITKTPEVKPAPPAAKIHWGMIVLAAILGRVLAWAYTGLMAGISHAKTTPSTNVLLGIALSAAVVNLKVTERRKLHSGLAAAGAVAWAIALAILER